MLKILGAITIGAGIMISSLANAQQITAGPGQVTFVNAYEANDASNRGRGFYMQIKTLNPDGKTFTNDPNYYGKDASSSVFNAMVQKADMAALSGQLVTISYSGYAASGAYNITEIYFGTPH